MTWKISSPLPVRAQQSLPLPEAARDGKPVTPVQRALHVIGAVEGLLVLGDEVPDQWHIAATAVLTRRARRYPIRNAGSNRQDFLHLAAAGYRTAFQLRQFPVDRMQRLASLHQIIVVSRSTGPQPLTGLAQRR
jgi:hypothetical protein